MFDVSLMSFHSVVYKLYTIAVFNQTQKYFNLIYKIAAKISSWSQMAPPL